MASITITETDWADVLPDDPPRLDVLLSTGAMFSVAWDGDYERRSLYRISGWGGDGAKCSADDTGLTESVLGVLTERAADAWDAWASVHRADDGRGDF